jgi:hypothetical protein
MEYYQYCPACDTMRRRGKVGADCGLCFRCCFSSSSASKRNFEEQGEGPQAEDLCPGHCAQIIKKWNEDKLLTSGGWLLKGEPKKLPKGTFVEPGFERLGETVTIWCVKDFFRSKWASQDVLDSQRRRYRNLRKGRNATDDRNLRKGRNATDHSLLCKCGWGWEEGRKKRSRKWELKHHELFLSVNQGCSAGSLDEIRELSGDRLPNQQEEPSSRSIISNGSVNLRSKRQRQF